ncbi:MAG TPA: thymidine phosphorylase [Woeseiaceae bacterium]|nr:thymidine phosphorylase [Woeseiaceae bacterium]
MLFTDVIRKKRDGQELAQDEIQLFVDGLADGSLPPEQVSALAMAIFLNGMSFEEAARLTTAMAASGAVLHWSDLGLDGPVVDKHSTGGVGDKVSFLLAPIAAACGCYVPMISGRGLGHTGGTLDKIGCIPGYNATPDFDLFRKVVREAGCAIIGQTAELAPADRRFYAIRDITGTVESIPLITASILSKKIAAGLDALVMDVKVGSGAFMKTVERAEELARSLIGTARKAGLRTHALITDMNEVLGTTAGNAVEIAESMEYLRDERREPRLDEVVLELCAEMLLLGGIESHRAVAKTRADRAVKSGAAAKAFDRMVSALGGPAGFVGDYDKYLPEAAVSAPVPGGRAGYLAEVDAFAVGNAIIALGGGRRKLDDALDLSVGFTDVLPVGTRLERDTPLAVVHAATKDAAKHAAGLLRKACRIADEKPRPRPVVYRTLQ